MIIVARRQRGSADHAVAGSRRIGPALKCIAGRCFLGLHRWCASGRTPPSDGRLGRLAVFPQIKIVRLVVVEHRIIVDRMLRLIHNSRIRKYELIRGFSISRR